MNLKKYIFLRIYCTFYATRNILVLLWIISAEIVLSSFYGSCFWIGPKTNILSYGGRFYVLFSTLMANQYIKSPLSFYGRLILSHYHHPPPPLIKQRVLNFKYSLATVNVFSSGYRIFFRANLSQTMRHHNKCIHFINEH